jgi:hypothetical protein
LTFGLGIIILQGVSRRKSLAGVNIMLKIHPPVEVGKIDPPFKTPGELVFRIPYGIHIS